MAKRKWRVSKIGKDEGVNQCEFGWIREMQSVSVWFVIFTLYVQMASNLMNWHDTNMDMDKVMGHPETK